jgi:hypothetical protein
MFAFFRRMKLARKQKRAKPQWVRLAVEQLEDRLAPSATVQAISLADPTLGGGLGNGPSGPSSISTDGRYVAFTSSASNLVPGDTNGAADVFVRDTLLGTTTRVSTGSAGNQIQGVSASTGDTPAIAVDGNGTVYVAFVTPYVVNGGTTNFADHIYVKNLSNGITTRVDTDSSGNPGNGAALDPALAIDGSGNVYVAFASTSTNLISDDTNGDVTDVFVKNLTTGATTCVSTDSAGNEFSGDSSSPALAVDGRGNVFVAFDSSASNLATPTNPSGANVFLKNLTTGVTTLVSTDSAGNLMPGLLFSPALAVDANGNVLVAFQNYFGTDNIFLKNVTSGVTTFVSTGYSAGVQGDEALAIDGSGNIFVAFWSDASNLVSGDTNAAPDVFIKNLTTDVITRVSTDDAGDQGNGGSYWPALAIGSGGSIYVAFNSVATNLINANTNGTSQMFLWSSDPPAAGFDSEFFPAHADTMADLIASTNLTWCGYYLYAPNQSNWTGWLGERQYLEGLGWQLAPLYAGEQDPTYVANNPQLNLSNTHPSASQGVTDGNQAADEMGPSSTTITVGGHTVTEGQGFNPGTVVYLDWEDGGLSTEANASTDEAYIVAWCQTVAGRGYTPGVYCPFSDAATIAQLVEPLGLNVAFWVANPNWHYYDPTEFTVGPNTFPTPNPSVDSSALTGSGYAGATSWQYQTGYAIQTPNGPYTVDLDTTSLYGAPTLSVSTLSLALPATSQGTAGAIASFTVSGSGLGRGDTVNLFAPAGSEISQISSSGFVNSFLLYPDASGNLSATTIYIRTSASATANVSGNLTIQDALDSDLNKSIPVSGIVQSDIDMQSAQLLAGETVQFTYSTTGNPGPFQVGLYQSTDGTTFDPTAPIPGVPTQTITPNPNGGQGTGTFTLPNSFSPDPAYPYLIVAADPSNAISESNETNNTASVLLPKAALTPSSLTFDAVQGGVDFSYRITGSDLTQGTSVAFYWASGPSFPTDVLQQLAYTYTVPAGTAAQGQPYGPINIDGSQLTGSPSAATYLLAVTDPSNTLGDFDPTMNVKALPLSLTLPQVYYQENQTGYLNGTGYSIHDYGCLLTDLSMELTYANIPVDPSALNTLLTGTNAFSKGGPDLALSTATSLASNALAPGSDVQWQWETNAPLNDKQELRDLVLDSGAPVVVKVANYFTDQDGVYGPHDHYVLVTGLAGNDDFVIQDPAYSGRTLLSFYSTNAGGFKIVGFVHDPSDLSALFVSGFSYNVNPNLVVRDDQGRLTGVDPETGQLVNEIPDSYAFIEGPLENIDGGPTINAFMVVVDIYQPGSGTFNVEVGNSQTEPFSLQLTNIAPDATVQSEQAIIGQNPSEVGASYEAALDASDELTQLKETPVFESLSAPIITYGTQAVTVSGHLESASLVPTGNVLITLNGVTNTAAITASGDFFSSFDTSTLSASSTPYGIIYQYAGDGDFTAANGHGFLIVNKASSTTTTVGDGPFIYDGSAQVGGSGTVTGAGLNTSATSVTFSANSDGTGVADQTEAGTYYVTAHYTGDANHTASDGLPVAIIINKADLYVTATANSKTYGDTASDTGSLSGVVNNDGITASFSSSGDVATASVAGSPYTITATLADPNTRLGNYTVIETDANLAVSAAGQTISFTPLASPINFAPNETETLSATGGASGNPVTFSIDASSTGTGSISGNVLTITGAGTFVLDADQADDGNYNAAPQAQQTLVVTPAPVTTASLIGTLGSNTWYVSDVKVTLSATEAGPAVAHTYYSVDGDPLKTYHNTFTVSGQGSNTVRYYSVDNAGTQESTETTTFQIDSVAPTTTASLAGALGNHHWYTSDVQVTLTGADATSGVAATYYQVDGGSLTLYSGAFEVGADGRHKVVFYSVDNAGNTHAAQTIHFKIDTQAPVTTASLGGTQGNNGWYTSAVHVTLTASDPTDPTGAEGSRVFRTYYSLDGGALTTYTGAFDLSAQGSHTVTFYAVDRAGNQESTENASFRIDSVKPTTTATLAGTPRTNGWYISSVDVTLSATDPNGAIASGLAQTLYQVDGGALTAYTGDFTVSGDDSHTVAYYSVDNAGNTEKTQTTFFKIDTAAPTTTAALTGTMGTNNWYVSAVKVKFTATDTTSGVTSTYYSLDNGPLITYNGALSVGSQGSHTVSFYSVDKAGNQEVASTISFEIDTVNPATVDSLTGTLNANGSYIGAVQVTLTASDAVSGMYQTYYQVDGGILTLYTGTSFTVTGRGKHTITFSSVDEAGNIEKKESDSFKIA